MAAVQVRDILDSIAGFYRRLSELCTTARQNTQGERLPYLLEYIAAHELQLATSVEQFEETAESGLLDTWLQFGADESLDGILAQLNIQSDMPEDDIVREVLNVDSKLIALYEALAGETSSPHVEELFEGLAQMQEARERQLARAAR